MSLSNDSFKTTFNEIASLYDKVRPGYPNEIIEAIIENSSLPDNASILEIGPGTGQITLPFAKRGYRILALELGENLAQLARRNLTNYPKVKVDNVALENWAIQTEAFNLFLSAQAFHWIKPEVGLDVAHKSLKPGGSIALVWNLERSQDTDFYKATTPLFEKYIPINPDRPTPPGSYELYRDALKSSKLFSNLTETPVSWEQSYSKADFIKLLNTFSPHIRLEPDVRAAFNAEVAGVIDNFGGTVTRRYQTALLLAKKQPA